MTLTAVCVFTLTWFAVHEWKHANPILDIRLLRQRNFATAVFMMFVLGMVLFGTTVLIPQFLQIQMGYTAENAGRRSIRRRYGVDFHDADCGPAGIPRGSPHAGRRSAFSRPRRRCIT